MIILSSSQDVFFIDCFQSQCDSLVVNKAALQLRVWPALVQLPTVLCAGCSDHNWGWDEPRPVWRLTMRRADFNVCCIYPSAFEWWCSALMKDAFRHIWMVMRPLSSLMGREGAKQPHNHRRQIFWTKWFEWSKRFFFFFFHFHLHLAEMQRDALVTLLALNC